MPDSNAYEPESPALEWQGEQPHSKRFDDDYYHPQGFEESRYVFIDGNDLSRRFQNLADRPATTLRVGETGFGSGRNFLVCWQEFLQQAPSTARLHFCSVERYPLTAQDISRSLSSWPGLEAIRDSFIEQLPPRIKGLHRRHYAGGRIVLDLYIGDALDWLADLQDGPHPALALDDARFDAWFLDGFAPQRNPEIWQQRLLNTIAGLCKPGATIATYTAASDVRRGLEAAGFAVEKPQGFSTKRHCLRGTRVEDKTTAQSLPPVAVPWYRGQRHNSTECHVVGAGLAGAHSARALAERGLKVTVHDRAATPGSAASANPAAILYTRLSPAPGALNKFTLAAYLYALHHYHRLGLFELCGQACGLLQLMQGEKALNHFQRLQNQLTSQQWLQFFTAQEAAERVGLAVDAPALWFTGSGWLDAGKVCAELLNHPGIHFAANSDVHEIESQGDAWSLRTDQGLTEAGIVIIANAVDCNRLLPSPLPVKTIRGQSSTIEVPGPLPKTVVCGERYCAPLGDQKLSIGASFDLDNDSLAVSDASHRQNLAAAQALLPDLDWKNARIESAHTGLRAVLPDYLPAVGNIPLEHDFKRDYADLKLDAKQAIPIPGRYYPGLYLNIGHGSRGLLSAPLCAELLASIICDECRPLPSALSRALSPARFIIRDLKRGQA